MNVSYSLYHKPWQIFTPISSAFSKLPSETWSNYKDLFQQHSTNYVRASFLAALAQIESDGNPIASTYWKWYGDRNFYQMLHPASSAFGIYQFTQPTFREAKQYCWKNAVSIKNKEECWSNRFRFRIFPSDSIYLLSARMNYYLQKWQNQYDLEFTTRQYENLAAVLHLCGKRKAEELAKNKASMSHIRCGDHSVNLYLSKIRKQQQSFQMLAANY